MNRGKTLWMVLTLAVVGAAALALPYATRGQNSPVATGNKGPDFVSFPQAAANIVAGLKIRTTLVNTGDETVQAVVSVFDSNGRVVKLETVTVAPGAMQSSEISCAAPPSITPSLATEPPGPCPGAGTAPQAADGSTPLHTEITITKHVDASSPVLISSGVVCDTSGPAPASCGGAGGTTGPTSLAKLAANHNETLVRDTAPMR